MQFSPQMSLFGVFRLPGSGVLFANVFLQLARNCSKSLALVGYKTCLNPFLLVDEGNPMELIHFHKFAPYMCFASSVSVASFRSSYYEEGKSSGISRFDYRIILVVL